MEVDIFFLENLIDIRTSAAQLVGKPSDAASLFVKNGFYKLARVNHALSLSAPPGFPTGNKIT